MRPVSRTSFAGLPWWFSLPIPTAGGTGLIPGQGTNIPHASQCGKKKKKKKRMLFGSQTPSWPWQPRSHTGVMRGFSGGMDGHVIALLPQSQTPAHPFIQTSPLFPMLLFLKPGASYFLSLELHSLSQGPSSPHSPQPHKCLTHTPQTLAKLKGTTNIVWVSWWEEGTSLDPDRRQGILSCLLTSSWVSH